MASLITTTTQAARDFLKLDDRFLFAVDEDGVEYVIDSIGRKQAHYDNPYEYYYALKLKKTGSGCIKR